MTGTPTYPNPPIVELVLGVQFSPLTKFTSGHFGLFWKDLGECWVDPSDGPILEDQFELFDRLKWSGPAGLQVRLEPIRLPGRFMVGHKSKDRLVQFQASRFHLNWRKRPDGVYLSYKSLIAEFEEMFAQFTAFAGRVGLGQVIPNQWELTYIDAFPKGEYWETPAQWSSILPGLFGDLFSTNDLSIELEHRAAEWSYEIKPRLGRLHLAAQPGRWGDSQTDALLLQTTARGPVGGGGVATLREGLDLGHDAAVGTFLRVSSEVAKTKWGTS